MSLSGLLNPEDGSATPLDDYGSQSVDQGASLQMYFDDQVPGNWFDEFMPEDSASGFSVSGYLGPHGVVESTVDEMQHGVEDWARTISANGINPQGFTVDWTDQLVPTASEDLDMPDASQIPESNITSTLEESADSSHRVCYGMIHGEDVKLSGDMTNLLTQLNPSTQSLRSDNVQTFRLRPNVDHILLLLPNGTAFGHLRDKLTKALTPLLKLDYLDFEAVALSQGVCGRISKMDKSGDAIVQVDINIYGPSDQGIIIGNILTEDKLWFQRPDYYKNEFPYENPHVIRFPELEGSMEFEEIRKGNINPTGRTDVNVLQLVSEIQASTHRADGLDRVTGDRRLQTNLLEFVHRITKTRSSIRPDEKGGGVLADEMGMGKTLSILALVINTIDQGHEWAQSSTNEELSHSDIEHHTHSTLVIVPSALLINSWIAEIKLHLGDAVRVTKYHGGGRERDTEAIARADIVLTTYKTLATDHGTKKDRRSPLHRIGWFRVVLDEAHNIRRPSTSFHRSCAALKARSRWCLTGTPIQNKLEDIGALFVFLKAEPFQSIARFRGYLVAPFEQQDPVAKERLVMLYDSLVLRRTKDILSLPGQEERIRKLQLSPAERLQYKKTTDILNRYIRQQVGEHEVKSKFGLFQAHLQLRILCNHGTHQKSFAWKRKNRSMLDEKEAFLSELGLNAERKCSGCYQPRPIINSNKTGSEFIEKCAHFLCRDCLDTPDTTQATTEGLQHCPICELSRKSPTQSTLVGNGGSGESADVVMRNADDDDRHMDTYFNHEGYSTKMTALVNDVKETLSESLRQEDGRIRKPKGIIFSCWTRTLDLVEVYLEREKIEFLRVDGECLMSKRQQILDQFSRRGGPRIMLMTTGTGAFGLNLTAANRIFIVELQWNPSVENQAIARAIRLRQKDKVIVTRYMIVNTVEQEMKSQQIKKEQAARAGFGGPRGNDGDIRQGSAEATLST
ncbi:hypothetical protein G7Z17_g2554 [Cylindrodendrum hubeiense]|uniref:Uncharacterized protein n=1 Tax=Cylindrodendrum hubeiense TaxID=595255 RepID=A0A9P5HIL4_9HYPO|nr:hypothetical protein G7Z17_g2554 [Cylindrodendrum hubeiense]